ncbi:MAG: two pore domain potassium channel family protein [Acidobacteria bacterium]|nr:two pore domain potassium channel family protein [Acidobacteriota bacterium]
MTEPLHQPAGEPQETDRAPSIQGELAIVLLALVSVALLVFEVASDATAEEQRVIEKIDLCIAVIFLGEFAWRLARADDRRQFFKRYWWELLASIPLTSEMTQALRGIRVLRIVRLLRLLRIVRLGVRLKILANRMEQFAGETSLPLLGIIVGAIMISGALGFHYLEFGVNQNVDSFEDSLWWAAATVTTVGYGDIYPVTTGGRLVAFLLMVSGIGAVGVFTAEIAAYVVRTKR